MMLVLDLNFPATNTPNSPLIDRRLLASGVGPALR